MESNVFRSSCVKQTWISKPNHSGLCIFNLINVKCKCKVIYFSIKNVWYLIKILCFDISIIILLLALLSNISLNNRPQRISSFFDYLMKIKTLKSLRVCKWGLISSPFRAKVQLKISKKTFNFNLHLLLFYFSKEVSPVSLVLRRSC